MRSHIRVQVCPYKLVLSLACVLVLASVQMGSFGMSAEPNRDTTLYEVVEKYIAATKAWPKCDYTIRRDRTDGHLVVFRVSHKDDAKALFPGGGKSVEVYVDPAKMEVSKELAFQ